MHCIVFPTGTRVNLNYLFSTKLGAKILDLFSFLVAGRFIVCFNKMFPKKSYTACLGLRDRSQCHRMHHSNGFIKAAAANDPGQKRKTAKKPELTIPDVSPTRNSSVLFCQHKATLPS